MDFAIGGINNPWFRVSKRDPRVVYLYSRHYSSKKNGKGTKEWKKHGIVSPGESITLITNDSSALFVWLKQRYHANNQTGINCAVFRNEGKIQSSELILAAEKIAVEKWGTGRLFTYVDQNSISSKNPGYCFKIAGWKLVRDTNGKPETTKRGLLILEKIIRN